MKTPLLTIAVPVYNGEKHLRDCVDSILAQEFKDFELLLIDDGSSDGSLAICRSYEKADDRVRVIALAGGGASKTRNRGMSEAAGTYISFIDCDDYIEPDHFAQMFEAKMRFGENTMVWICIRTVSDYSRTVTGESRFSDSEATSRLTLNDIMELHEKWLDASPCNKLYKTNIIRNNGLHMDEGLSLGEDLLFNIDYFKATDETEIAVVNKCTYNYVRVGKESLGSKYYPDMLDIVNRIHEALMSFVMSRAHTKSDVDKVYNAWFFKLEVVLHNTFSEKNNAGLLAKLAYNKMVMGTPEFKAAFEATKPKLDIFHKMAYSAKSYYMVSLFDRLYSLKRKLAR